MMLVDAIRLGRRLFKPAVGWPILTLTAAVALLTAWGVIEAQWVDGDVLFFPMTLLALLVSVLLAHTHLAGVESALISVAIGLLYVSNAVSRFLLPLWAGLCELWSSLGWLATWVWRRDALPFEGLVSMPAFVQLNESRARLAYLGQRLAAWAGGVGGVFFGGGRGGQIEHSPVVFLFVSGMVLWGCTVWAVWWVTRRGRALLAVLPLSGVLGLSVYFSGAGLDYVFGHAACLLLLWPILRLHWQERRWEREGIDYSTEIRFDVWQMAALVAVVILVLAWITPAINVPRLARAFWQFASHPQETAAEFLTRFFGGVQPAFVSEMPNVSRPGDVLPSAVLPRAHLMGGGADLAHKMVMSVCIDAPPPVYDRTLDSFVGPRYYWRGITYAMYDGRRWFNAHSSLTQIQAYEPVIAATFTSTGLLKQRYLIQASHGDSLYAVGEPQVVDQVVYSRRRTPYDLIGLEGESSDYVVFSRVPAASGAVLNEAATVYPEQIVEAYLGMPEQVPERVLALAAEITQGAETPFEKALLIESYLRMFPYDLNVPAPPAKRDAVDYFMFELQRGYCDYYASSFVIMARAVGIPARLAVGYTMGKYDPGRGCYVVTEQNAHSWAEVYFPEYGWFPFEPTASLPPVERALADTPLPASVSQDRSLPSRVWHVALRAWWRRAGDGWPTFLAVVLALALLVASILWRRERQRWKRLTPRQRVAACYERMGRSGRWFGAPYRPQDTPFEYRNRLAQSIGDRGARWSWLAARQMAVTARVNQGIDAICHAYLEASYSTRPVDAVRGRQAKARWRRLRGQMGWLWVISRARRT